MPPRAFIFPDGGKFHGEAILVDGVLMRNGPGSNVAADGTAYNGEWKQDMMHGPGRLEFTSGAVYEVGSHDWPMLLYSRRQYA